MKEKLLHLIIAITFCTGISFAQCPIGDVTFNDQADVDNFATDYPACTTLPANLVITGSVTNLNALSNITGITGYLDLSNSSLTSLNGMNNVTSINGIYIYSQFTNLDMSALSNLQTVAADLLIYDTNMTSISLPALTAIGDGLPGYFSIAYNANLTSIAFPDVTTIDEDFELFGNNALTTVDFDNLTNIDGYFTIVANPVFTNVDGFSNLNNVGKDFLIRGNSTLISLLGLENLETIGGYFFIDNNDALTDITALAELKSINGYLAITDNANLASIIGIQNIDPATINNLGIVIYDNPLLSTCSLNNTCAYLAGAGPRNITNNATGCNDDAEITATCATTCSSTTEWNGTFWSNGTPDITKEVIISGNFTSTNDLEACKFTVTNNAEVTIGSGFDLTVKNAITTTSGSLHFENNANLLQDVNTMLNSNTGDITYLRNASMRRQDYVYWSSPVDNQKLLDFSEETLPNRFYTLNETTNAYSMVPSPATTDFEATRGYVIRAPNTFPANGNTATFQGLFVGTPHNGDYNFMTTVSAPNRGFNLLGNPYPSPISAETFLDENDGALYFWTHFSQDPLAGSNFASYTTLGTAAAAGGETPNGFIQAGQGFLFKPVFAGQGVFTNVMRSGNNAGQFFRIASAEKHRIWLNLSASGNMMNQTLLGYMDNATPNVDASIDALLNYNGSSISSRINDESYVIQGRSLPFDNSDEVALNFKAAQAGNFELAIDHLDGIFAEDQNVFLKDKLNGIVHNIKENPYQFVSEAGTFANRFAIVYQSAPLNVDTPVFNTNSFVVFKKGETLFINSSNVSMNSVKLFDISGRLIFEKNNIDNTIAAIENLNIAQQVLLVQITSGNKTITKKVIY